MYIKDRFHQFRLAEFDQAVGLKMNHETAGSKKQRPHMVCYRWSFRKSMDTSTVNWWNNHKEHIVPVFCWNDRISAEASVCSIASFRIP